MTLLDEAISELEAVANNKIEFVKNSCCCDDTEIEDEYIKSAEVHLQIAEWLKDYKRLIRQEARGQKTESTPEIYWCDPEKNKACRKTRCQKECFMTTKKEYAKTEEEAEKEKNIKIQFDRIVKNAKPFKTYGDIIIVDRKQ